MINKIYKRIHNKYSILFKFIFFLRYFFGFFFISFVLFLSTPYFFDFKKKDEIIKDYLLKDYDLKLQKYENIEYKSLPIPNLEIHNANIQIGKKSIVINVKQLSIYPKLLNIYNFENFQTTKIILDNSEIIIKDTDLKILGKYIYNLKKKLSLRKLDLKINSVNTKLINLKEINFSNFGYNKNLFKGKLLNQNFKISISDDYNQLNFKLLKSGVNAYINFNEKKQNQLNSGVLKSRILNSNLKFNFDYDEKKFKINKLYFRDKNLSFNNESLLTYKPFFYLDSISNIEDFNIKFIEEVNLTKILSLKEFIKKINLKKEINFKRKKIKKNLIDNFNLNFDLAYGRLNYLKKFSISDNFFECKGEINLLEENPILYFDCSITSNDKKKLLKIFSINYKNKKEQFKLSAAGNINILNNKINFTDITSNQTYKSSKEDLEYFKQSFESIIFDEDFWHIFNVKKIKDFIIEIT